MHVHTVIVVALLLGLSGDLYPAGRFADLRLQMIADIEENVRETSLHIDKNALDERVMTAMATVPRHLFVPAEGQEHAYENRPLAIGYGQTISQPYIVALMTDLLRPQSHHRVLELGTGSGYQAAVLGQLVDHVYTMEIIRDLGERAGAQLAHLGYRNITTRVADGYYGWEEHAPFDSIIVTAASGHVPPALLRQLKPGGRMVIPVGGRFQVQHLMLIEKTLAGKVKTRQILPVRFVPLTGEH